MNLKAFLIAFLIAVIGGGCFLAGVFVHRAHSPIRCPEKQVMINGECFTPGVYYTDAR